MSALAGIVSGLAALAGVIFKAWLQNKDIAGLEAQLHAETARADAAYAQIAKDQSALEERVKQNKALEASIAEHLKTCAAPLAAWANSLRRTHPDR